MSIALSRRLTRYSIACIASHYFAFDIWRTIGRFNPFILANTGVQIKRIINNRGVPHHRPNYFRRLNNVM